MVVINDAEMARWLAAPLEYCLHSGIACFECQQHDSGNCCIPHVVYLVLHIGLYDDVSALTITFVVMKFE